MTVTASPAAKYSAAASHKHVFARVVDANGATGSQGNVASGDPDSGNPVKVAGVYNSTLPTFTNGDRADLQVGSRGALRVQLHNPDGATAAPLANPGDAASNSLNALGVDARNSVFNGTNWDRQRGNTVGTYVIPGAFEFETVAASQTDQMLGATGAVGDYLDGLLVIPATTSPGAISIEYGATNITVFAGGASSVQTLHPFFIPIGLNTPSDGGWEITTGANVSVIARGYFT
jgi:hypothetical protein